MTMGSNVYLKSVIKEDVFGGYYLLEACIHVWYGCGVGWFPCGQARAGMKAQITPRRSPLRRLCHRNVTIWHSDSMPFVKRHPLRMKNKLLQIKHIFTQGSAVKTRRCNSVELMISEARWSWQYGGIHNRGTIGTPTCAIICHLNVPHTGTSLS